MYNRLYGAGRLKDFCTALSRGDFEWVQMLFGVLHASDPAVRGQGAQELVRFLRVGVKASPLIMERCSEALEELRRDSSQDVRVTALEGFDVINAEKKASIPSFNMEVAAERNVYDLLSAA